MITITFIHTTWRKRKNNQSLVKSVYFIKIPQGLHSAWSFQCSWCEDHSPSSNIFPLFMNTTTFHCVSMLSNNLMELSFFSEVPTNAYEASSKCNKHPTSPPHYSAKTHHAVIMYDNRKYKVHILLLRSPTEQTKTKNTWTTTGIILESKYHVNFSDRISSASKLLVFSWPPACTVTSPLPFQSTTALFQLHLHVIADSWSTENNLLTTALCSRTAPSP